jgi:hypothetical protein
MLVNLRKVLKIMFIERLQEFDSFIFGIWYAIDSYWFFVNGVNGGNVF